MSPLDFTYARKSGQAVVTVFMSGQSPRPVDTNHPHFDTIWSALQAPDHNGLSDQELFDLADVERGVALRFQRLSERVTVRDRTIFFDGDPVDNALAKQLLRVLGDNGDLGGLVAFYERVMTNPLEHGRNELYKWVDKWGVTIVADGPDAGKIIGYKGGHLNGDGIVYSGSSGRAIVDGEVIEGKIPYPLGSVVEMPRSEIHHTPGKDCGSGLHVGTLDYARGFGDTLMKVMFDPRDVVNVPDISFKVRVCRLRVLEILGAGRERHEVKPMPTTVSVPEPPPEPKPVDPTAADHVPTHEEWDDMVARAKRRRQNFLKYASTTGGWKFNPQGEADPKDPLNWTVPAAPPEEPQEAAQEPTEGQGEGVWVAGTWVPDQPSVADRSTLIPADKVRITAEAQDRGIDWEPTWPEIEEDDSVDRRAVADFGVWQVISDDEEKSLFAGDSGQLTAEVVGAAQFGNERVAFYFTPEGMDAGEEVSPFEEVEPLRPKSESVGTIAEGEDEPPLDTDLGDEDDEVYDLVDAGTGEVLVTAEEMAEEEFVPPGTASSPSELSPALSPLDDPYHYPEGRQPSQMEFMKMQGRAKVRRQNFQKYASTTGGWKLVGDDPKARESWRIAP